MATPPEKPPGPESAVMQGYRQTFETILRIAGGKDKEAAQAALDMLKGQLAAGGDTADIFEVLILFPGKYGIELPIPLSIKKLVSPVETLEDYEADLDPGDFTASQKRVYASVKRTMQGLYNMKVANSPAVRREFENRIKPIRESVQEKIERGAKPDVAELMIVDALDHPEKYNLRIVIAETPGRPVAVPVKPGRKARVVAPPTVKSVPAAGGRRKMVPAVPVRVTAENVCYLITAGEVAKRSNPGAYAEIVDAMQAAIVSPIVSAEKKEVYGAALRGLGEKPNVPSGQPLNVPEYLARGEEGAEELANALKSYYSSGQMDIYKKIMRSGSLKGSGRALEGFWRQGFWVCCRPCSPFPCRSRLK